MATDVSRRTFVATAAVASAAAAIPAAAFAESAKLVPGTYTAQGFGKWPEGSTEGARYGSPKIIEPTIVEVDVDETDILAVRIIACSDTPDLVAPVAERIPAAIVAAQSTNIDVVTGCTLTSLCVINLVRDCLAQAGAAPEDYSTPPVRSTATETYDADVCVVGSGGATCAALAASEQGKKVIVLEKCGRLGGNTAWATGPFSVGSVRQIAEGSVKTADEVFPEWMEYSCWKCNAPLAYNILSYSGPTMDWLQDYWDTTDDAGFEKIPSGNGYEITWKFSQGTHKFTALYEQVMAARGVEVLMETRAKQVVLDADGKACGVIATRQDGTEVVVNAPAVVIGCGGYAGNPEMLERYVSSSEFYVKGMTSSTGDGITMCLDAGSSRHNEMSVAMATGCGNRKVDIYSGYMKNVNQICPLLVDPAGERFMNEELCVTQSIQAGGSAIRRVGHFYAIVTQNEIDAWADHGFFGLIDDETIAELGYRPRLLVESMPSVRSELDQMLAVGEAWKADTLEELAEVAPFTASIFLQSIADYAEACTTGVDKLFGKRPALLRPLSEGPFYAIRCIPAIDGTLGVIRVDSHLRCLGEDLNPIPGLWCIGSDAAGYFSNPYTPYVGSTSCWAVTGGRIAGESACAYLDSQA